VTPEQSLAAMGKTEREIYLCLRRDRARHDSEIYEPRVSHYQERISTAFRTACFSTGGDMTPKFFDVMIMELNEEFGSSASRWELRDVYAYLRERRDGSLGSMARSLGDEPDRDAT
jgi:hypothetical protein